MYTNKSPPLWYNVEGHSCPVSNQQGEQSRALASARISMSDTMRWPRSIRWTSRHVGFHAPSVTCAIRPHRSSCPN